MIRRSDVSHLGSVICLILGLFLCARANAAGIGSLLDEFIPAGSVRTSFKEITENPNFQKRFIGDINASAGPKAAAAALKKTLRLKLYEFVSLSRKVEWTKSDIISLLDSLLSTKCTANVSCQIAFDMSPLDVEPFIKEIGQTIKLQVEPKLAGYQIKEAQMMKELGQLPEESPAYKLAQEDFMRLRDEEMPLYELSDVADRLSHESGAPNLDGILSSCGKK